MIYFLSSLRLPKIPTKKTSDSAKDEINNKKKLARIKLLIDIAARLILLVEYKKNKK